MPQTPRLPNGMREERMRKNTRRESRSSFAEVRVFGGASRRDQVRSGWTLFISPRTHLAVRAIFDDAGIQKYKGTDRARERSSAHAVPKINGKPIGRRFLPSHPRGNDSERRMGRAGG